MVKRKRDGEETTPNTICAGKRLYSAPTLAPDLSELLHKTCRKAATNPLATNVLSDGIRRLHSQVTQVCEEGESPTSAQELCDVKACDLWGYDEFVGKLVPCEKQRANMLFLERACEDEWPINVVREIALPDADVTILDTIRLRTTPLEDDCIALFDSAEELGCELNSAHQESERERLGLTMYVADKCRLDAENIVGTQIEVFSVAEVSWRSGFVGGRLEDGRYVVFYFDGGVEYLDLGSRLWRAVD